VDGSKGNTLVVSMRGECKCDSFKGCTCVVLFMTEIKTKSVKTQLSSICYTEQYVSAHFRSSPGLQF
jgi:hypothetical protein